jgi:hypothetical protein
MGPEPKTSRDFQQAAIQRLSTAEFLLANNYTLDAFYLTGYTIECTFKCLILRLTPIGEVNATLERISTHSFERLAGILKDIGMPVPANFTTKMRRYSWGPFLRYRTGRTTIGHTRGFLKLAKQICHWVEKELAKLDQRESTILPQGKPT